MLYRSSITSDQWWGNKNELTSNINYYNREIICKSASDNSLNQSAAVFDKGYIAFQKHFNGNVMFFLSNSGFNFMQSPKDSKTKTIEAFFGPGNHMAMGDYANIQSRILDASVDFCYFAWGIPESFKKNINE